MTFYLHDAVYLYLQTVNQTYADGHVNYRDGHLIRNRTVGHQFSGEFPQQLPTRDSCEITKTYLYIHTSYITFISGAKPIAENRHNMKRT